MMDKFAGVGLKNIVVIWLFVMILNVMAKVIITKYPVNGLKEFIYTA